MHTKSILLKQLLAIALIVSALGSCNVDRFPFGAIEQSQAFQTVSDGVYWNNLVYNQLRGRVYNLYTFSQDVQADQLNASVDYGNRNGNPHRWTFFADDGTLTAVWAGYYTAIANINVMLEGFETIAPADAEEAAQLDLYKGDAYLARAYYHHCLVVRYANMYNPATAATDLGVPLVLTYDLEARPSRATVQQVYEQILADIALAKTSLASQAGAPGSSRFTIDAALALEARVKLYMNDWTGALTAAQTLIAAGTYPLYSTGAEVRNMWRIDASGEDIFSPAVTMPDEGAPTNNIYLGYNVQNNYYIPDFLPSQWVVDMFDDRDFRKGAYFANVNLNLGGRVRQGYWVVNKYPGNPAYFTSNTTNYMHRPKVFRIGEIYLIAAEAAYRANGGNTDAVLTFLNTLRQARGLPALAGISGEVLFDEIKNERFRELAFEGFRLDDLRRWGEGFTRRAPQSLDFIQTGSDFNTKAVEASDPKFVWGIPLSEQTINPNLVQNEGW